MTDKSENSVVSDEDRERRRSGHTPTSVGVRVDEESQDMEYSTGSSASVVSTASDADPTEDLSGTSG